MGTSAIVVTYNRIKLLKECISNLLQQTYSLDYIFIINNNSTDGTSEYLSKLHNPKIIVINTHKNLGGAGGFSLGTKLAFEKSSSKYFWLMDDDTMPTKNALSQLMKATKKLHNKFGFLCSNVRWWKNNEPAYMNIPAPTNDWTTYINNGLIKLKFASFVSLLVNREAVKHLGLPIADMFIWGDDVEYTTRISQKYNSYLAFNSIVLHKSTTNARTNSIIDAPVHRFIYYRCMFRNRIFIARRYYGLKKTLKLISIYLITFVKILCHARNHKIKRLFVVFRGIINGMFFNPKIRFPKDK